MAPIKKKAELLSLIRHPKKIGSRREVIEGLAEQTSGGLHSWDFDVSAYGKIVSAKKRAAGYELAKRYAKEFKAGRAPEFKSK